MQLYHHDVVVVVAAAFTLVLLTHQNQTLAQKPLPNALNGTGPLAPAIIVFGDSIMDAGNNNHLKTIVKADFPPYGYSFPGRQPTGRFSNGKIASDFIASTLGVKELLPPYLGADLSAEELLTGVTFASAGTGYDALTSEIGSVISMFAQLELFKEYKDRIRSIAGEKRAATIISDSLYVVCTGSDDVANTYSLVRKKEYDIPSYAKLLLRSASIFLQNLVDLGARRIGVVGIPPIGCVPSQRTLSGGILRGCSEDENQIALLFNSEISKEIQRLNSKRGATNIVFIDVYTVLFDIIQHPHNYGFGVSSKGCCGTGALEVSVLCNGLTSTTCLDVYNYVFWDSYHPTEKGYKILVDWINDNYVHKLFK